MLELASTLPRYAQIAMRLQAQIQAGQYPPGARIPSEHELAARFGVGRPTVRQATELLVRDRVLARRRGSGTYVKAPPPEVDLFSAGGTLSSFAKSGLSLETTLLGNVCKRRIPASSPHAFAGRMAFFVLRRSELSRVPVLLEEMYFDPEIFPDLDRHAISGRSLSDLARERYLLRPVAQDQRFRACSLDGRRARLLKVPPGREILRVERSVDFEGAPRAVFAELFCRTDQVVFAQHLDLTASDVRCTSPNLPPPREPDLHDEQP